MSRLSKISVPNGFWDDADEALHVTTPHAMVQAAGYLKYAANSDGPVYFRGQSRKYGSMRPSLFRDCKTINTMKKRVSALGDFRNRSRSAHAFLTGTPKHALDPLLQHYGIRTNWLDLVDNLWVALWFSCYDAIAHGKRGQYLHFEPRRADPSSVVYIALVQCGAVSPVDDSPGLWRSADLELVDLRVAAPSLYLRPHAQHGLLVRRHTIATESDGDLSRHVVGWLRAPLVDALSWIGKGGLLTVHSLFPPPRYDLGCERLLHDLTDVKSRFLGSIHHVGA